MGEDSKTANLLSAIEAEVWFTASRSGGPGGQHVNKVSSRVTLHWDVSKTAALTDQERALITEALGNRISNDGVLLVHADEERSQHKNKEIALARLAELLSEALTPPKPRQPTKMTAGQKQRRLDDKKHRSELKKQRRPPSNE